MKSSDNSAYDCQSAVILVHGTWPRGPFRSSVPPNTESAEKLLWYQPGSTFCKLIADSSGMRFCFGNIFWSGSNSSLAREQGAEKLSELLRKLEKECPGQKRFIVVHSHGGSVALLALRDQSVAKLVAGVVFLSTPFVSVSVRRGLNPELLMNIKGFIAMAGALFAMLLLMIVVPPILEFNSMRPEAIAGLIRSSVFLFFNMLALVVALFMALGILLIFPLWALGNDEWLNKLHNSARTHAEKWTLALPSKFPALIVRPVEDEASATMTVLPFVAWIVSYAEQLCFILFIAVTTLMGLGRLVSCTSWSYAKTVNSCIDAYLGIAIVAPIIMFVVIQAIRALAHLPIGFGLSLYLPLLRVSVEASPPGVWPVLQLQPTEGSGLFHSAPHEDPKAVEGVGKWLAEQNKLR